MNNKKQLIIDIIFNYCLWKFYDYTINDEINSFVVPTILFMLPYIYQYFLWFCYENKKKGYFYLVPIIYFITILIPLFANRLGLHHEISPHQVFIFNFLYKGVTFKIISYTIFITIFITFFIHFFIEREKGQDSNEKDTI